MRENVVQSRTVYPSKLLVKCEDKVMSFSDMKSLRNLTVCIEGNGEGECQWERPKQDFHTLIQNQRP